MMKSLLLIAGPNMRSLLIATAILVSVVSVRAQEASRTVDRTYQFDDRGDASIQYSFQLGASQWAQWKNEFGDHPDILLRNLKYQLAAAVIDDFSLEKDEVHRTAVAKIKARALANYLGNGQFAVRVPKFMKLVAGSGLEWVFTNSTLEQGGIVNETDRAKLPPKAQNAHLVTGNDYNELVYSLDLSPSKPALLLYTGIFFLLIGGGLAGLTFLLSGKPGGAVPPPVPV